MKNLKQLQVGDFIVIYIKGKKIGGLFEVRKKDSQKEIKFEGGDYPLIVELIPIVVRDKPLDIDGKFMKKISRFSEFRNWGVVLMGKSILEINENDYKLFKEILENGKK